MRILFWTSFIVLFYTYVGYWFILYILSKTRKKNHKMDTNLEPTVSLVIPAHNEEEFIEEKIKNCLALDYPQEKLEIIVGSDSSEDKTVELAQKYPSVKVLDFKKRSGKMATLNKVVKGLTSDIIVFTDSNALFKKDAIKKLVAHFADENIGCVGGRKTIHKGDAIEKCEGIYWKYENSIKVMESDIASCCGVDGSIYAVRRELYPFPEDKVLIMDDLAVSLGIIGKGKRVIFEKNAISYEKASETSFHEFRRKIRIMIGALNAIKTGIKKPILFQLISHKILRWSGGIFMLILLISNFFVYHPFLVIQFIFYGLAICGLIFEWQNLTGVRQVKRTSTLFYAPYYFCLTNLAQIVGFVKYIKGEKTPYWEKIKRKK